MSNLYLQKVMRGVTTVFNKVSLSLILGMIWIDQSFAGGGGGSTTIGGVADTVTKSFGSLAKLITAAAYIAGLGFAVGAVLKFKQHKDNPTQIPIGTPIALLFIAAALIFLPTIFNITGQTLFGGGGEVGGPYGTVFQAS